MGSIAQFASSYLLPSDLQNYGLPTPDVQSDIMNQVQFASQMMDEACGRVDGDGNGSLTFTQYTQRILLQTANRNLVQLAYKPIIGLTQAQVSNLQASGAAYTAAGNDSQPYYTGVQPSLITNADGLLSGILAASGRYGYSRQNMSLAYPDLFAFINPLNLVTMFGGPAPWVAIDVSNMSYDYKNGEVWIPAGLQLQKYSEIWITYTAGYDPTNLPRTLKHVCASIIKNSLLKGDGTTGLTSLSMSRAGANAVMGPLLIDPNLDAMLASYKKVQAY